MTDYVLRAADETAMYAGYAQVGILNEDGTLREQGSFPDGSAWAMADVGTLDGQTGYWCLLRWNSEVATPPLPASISIEWQTGDAQPYPAGVPMFA